MTGEEKKAAFRNSDIVVKVDFLRKLNLENDNEIVFKTFGFGKNTGKEFLVTMQARDAGCLLGAGEVSFFVFL